MATDTKVPGAVPLRYRPPEVPDAPPDTVEVLLRREAFVTVNGHVLKLVEPPFRFYTDMLKALVGRGDTGLLSRVMTALRAVAAKGGEADVEMALLESLIGESADFVCDFLARLLLASNDAEALAAFDGLIVTTTAQKDLADWIAENVPASGMAALVTAALYVCDAATLRGFFVSAAGTFRRGVKT